jgi:hypothetical protein
MAEIIVSLRHAYQSQEIDLEVSPDQMIREFTDLIAAQQGWITPALIKSLDYSIEVAPGKNLSLDQTFRQANLWSGASLIFHPPASSPQKENPNSKKTTDEKPGYRFIRLD